MNPSRRRFIAAGALGTAALIAAGWWGAALRHASRADGRFLSEGAASIVRAIVPAMLGTALPQASNERAAAIGETVQGVDAAIAGLPPAARHDLARLFSLLEVGAVRRVMAGVSSRWEDARPDEVGAFLADWQASRWAVKRSAYDALHQLVMGAWYGNPRSWTAIGYPGPPQL